MTCTLPRCAAEHDRGNRVCVVDVPPVPVLDPGTREPVVLLAAYRDLRGDYIELDVDNRTARVLLADLAAAVTAAGAALGATA